MAARHFNTDGTRQPSRSGQGRTPRHGRPAAGGNASHDGNDPAQLSDNTYGGLGQSTGFDPLPIGQHIPANQRQGTQHGTGYGYPSQPRVYGAKPTADARPRRRVGPVIAVVLVVVALCLLGVGAWSLLSSSSLSDIVANTNTSSQQNANTTSQQDASTDQNQAADSASQATTASDIVSTLSSLQHNGEDCSLPTDGVEVDVLGGRVLVAFQSSESAEQMVSRMASASVALADALSQAELADSSTTSDGVSQVPAASTPGAIASSENGTAFAGVEVVALAESRYVVAAITLGSSSGLADASEAAIFDAADSYAVQGTAYAYSGLRALGVEQSKGDAPALLTGEAITISMSIPRTTSSSSSTNTTSSQSSSSSSTGSSTSSSTSSTSGRNTSSGSSYGSSSTGSSYGYSTGYSGGSSSYSYDSGSDSGSSTNSGSSGSSSTGSDSTTSTDTGSTSGSGSQDDSSSY